MKLIERLAASRDDEVRYGMDDYLSWVQAYGNGAGYNYGQFGGGPVLNQTIPPGSNAELIGDDFAGYVNGIYRRNGPAFALMAFRSTIFSQVRWQYRRFNNGRPGDLWGNPALETLNGNNSLTQRMIQDVDLAGNFYGVLRDGVLMRLRPDWVQIVMDKPMEAFDAKTVGYVYHPNGIGLTSTGAVDREGLRYAETFLPAEVVHWAPTPDPEAHFRGMSWLTPVIREIRSDGAATNHKLNFFSNGGTPNLVFKMDAAVSFENFVKFKENMQEDHTGVHNAYRPLFIGGGADVTAVGSTLQQLDFENTQGRDELRLASAAGVPAILVGFMKGLDRATYANYGLARRAAADQLFHPLWVSAAAALANVVPPPTGSQLWYDARDIPFLREDSKDDAEIRTVDAASIGALVNAGYDPDTVVDAVTSGDLKRLQGHHLGLYSVQLQPPGSGEAPGDPNDPKTPAAAANAPAATTK